MNSIDVALGAVDGVSIHEAGHAVVAVYLRLPLLSVRVLRPDFHTMSSRGYVSVRTEICTKGRVDAAVASGDYAQLLSEKLTDRATMVLGGRAADTILLGRAATGYDYQTDERGLREIADMLSVPTSEFHCWRERQLERAQAILATPYVWKAVHDVARALDTAAYGGKRGRGVSGREVRALLRLRAETEQTQGILKG